MLALCLDIGGTKIAAGLVDADGALVHTSLAPTPANAAAERVWDVVAALIADELRQADGPIEAVGIASAGPIDLPGGRVSPINIAGWRGFPLRDRVAARSGAGRAGAARWRRPVYGARRALARSGKERATICWAWWCPPGWGAG